MTELPKNTKERKKPQPKTNFHYNFVLFCCLFSFPSWFIWILHALGVIMRWERFCCKYLPHDDDYYDYEWFGFDYEY